MEMPPEKVKGEAAGEKDEGEAGPKACARGAVM